ncbi:hypothetical protein AB833_25690 [Chromatiales bacterium (ex Bugula neritina AB1)]|nr:hypothetical protein AB833_25690 [Chromatiales bacterium (ex Bugula neritina AB1)]
MAISAQVRKALLFTLASAAIAGVGVYFCWIQIKDSMASYSMAKSLLRETGLRVDRDIKQVDFLENDWSDYQRLKIAGKIGAGDRLVWIDAFEEIHAGMSDFHIEYEMMPVELLSPGDSHLIRANAGDGGNNSSVSLVRINLNLAFTHDADLYQFFEKLYKNVKATFIVSELKVNLLDPVSTPVDANADSTTEPGNPQWNISAICEIHWYIVTLPVKKQSVNS